MGREIIEKTKRDNGWTGKEKNQDLIFYVIGRVDEMHNKMDEVHLRLGKDQSSIQYLKWITGGIITGGVIAISFIFNIII